MAYQWITQVFGKRNSAHWEISVVREDNKHGRRSWGWFDDRKIMISSSVPHSDWTIPGYVFDQQVKIAGEIARRLNAGEGIDQ
jgi:hypothetical protein